VWPHIGHFFESSTTSLPTLETVDLPGWGSSCGVFVSGGRREVVGAE
jgi:hypothetical protein